LGYNALEFQSICFERNGALTHDSYS